MKRTTAAQRRFGPGEISILATQCMEAIFKGVNVIDFLASKGVADPAAEWYDIRRWIKSNKSEWYAQIPTSLRLELPVKRINPDSKTAAAKSEDGSTGTQAGKETEEGTPEQKAEEEAKTPPEQPKRRPGRPPKTRTEETPVKAKKPRKTASKAKEGISLKVGSMIGRDLNYEVGSDGRICITFLDDVHNKGELTLSEDELRNLADEIPALLKAIAG